MLQRCLTIASILSLAGFAAVVLFSLASYTTAYDLRGRFVDGRSFAAVAMQGRLMVVVTPTRDWPWMLRRYRVDELMEFPSELVRPKFPGVRWDFPLARTVRVMVPLWLVALVAAAPAGILRLRRPWRFTLRGLFVATTLVAVLLAMIAWLK